MRFVEALKGFFFMFFFVMGVLYFSESIYNIIETGEPVSCTTLRLL